VLDPNFYPLFLLPNPYPLILTPPIPIPTAQETANIGMEGGSVVLAIATALHTFPFNAKADQLTLDLIESCVQVLLGMYIYDYVSSLLYF
jgi:hypothetical protein